jgi:hypothetical protein
MKMNFITISKSIDFTSGLPTLFNSNKKKYYSTIPSTNKNLGVECKIEDLRPYYFTGMTEGDGNFHVTRTGMKKFH